MKLHLLRSSEFNKENFQAIHALIGQYPGPVHYVVHERPVEYTDDDLIREIWDDQRMDHKVMFRLGEPRHAMMVDYLHWEDLFEKCEKSRRKFKIPDEEVVVLLTDHANELNWFSAADPDGKLNFFVHTEMWERFITDDFRYPVVYELASIPLQLRMFDSFQEQVDYAHREPRGCMNDLCLDKSQIGLKLRTGDICPDCKKRIHHRRIDPQLIGQVFRIFEGIRSQMLFCAAFTETEQPSRLVLDYNKRKLFLTDLGDLEIHLNPMEFTVYHFFLNHPEGILFNSLSDYQSELLSLYNHYSNADSIATIQGRVVDLVANNKDCLSQVISRIRRRFELALGERISGVYIIGGDSGRKRRIRIERVLVTILN